MILNAWLREKPANRSLTLIRALNQLLVAHLNQDNLLHSDVGLDGLELPHHLIPKIFSFFFCPQLTVASRTTAPVLSAFAFFFGSVKGQSYQYHRQCTPPNEQTPHHRPSLPASATDVLRRRLLHVLLLVAQHEVRLHLQVLLTNMVRGCPSPLKVSSFRSSSHLMLTTSE